MIIAEEMIEELGPNIGSISSQEAKPIITMYQKAFDLGDEEAAGALGYFYCRLHEKTEEAEKSALSWLRLAAIAGDPRAQYDLGRLLSTGNFVELDWEEAEKWLRLAVQQGVLEAQKGLEYLVKMRDPHSRDEVIRMSIESGHTPPRLPKKRGI